MKRFLSWDVLTNLSFLVFGAAAIGVSPLRMGFAFGLGMVAVGVGSSLLHSAAVPWGRHADVLSMYVVGTVLLFAAFGLHGAAFSVIALLGGLGLGFWLRWEVAEPMERKIGVMYLGVLVAASIRSLWLPATWWLIGLGTLLLLVALWARFGWTVVVMLAAIAIRKRWHGAWHILSSVGLTLYAVGVS